jgi:hypothetical protein
VQRKENAMGDNDRTRDERKQGPRQAEAAAARPADKSRESDQSSGSGDGLQGEGNYAAARRYRKGVSEFVENTDIEGAARAAEPRDERQAEELKAAEEAGRSRKKS